MINGRGVRMIGIGREPVLEFPVARTVCGRVEITLGKHVAEQAPVGQRVDQPVGATPITLLLQPEDLAIAIRLDRVERLRQREDRVGLFRCRRQRRGPR